MQFWIVQTLNSLALGGLLFLLAAGFSLIFGLMRIANLTHGSLFMLGAYLGVTALKFVPNLWLAALLAGTVGRRVWRAARAVPSASAGRQRAGTGAGDAGYLVHRRRRLPHRLGRRPDPDRGAGFAATADRRRQCRLSGLSSGRARHRDRDCDRVASADGAHPARCDDSRRRRRHANGAGGGHSSVAAVHHGVLPRRRSRGRGRRDRGTHHVRVPRAGCGNVAARADRGHPRRRRQLARRLRRQLHYRGHLYVRLRAAARSGVCDPVPADDLRDRIPPARPVREAGA